MIKLKKPTLFFSIFLMLAGLFIRMVQGIRDPNFASLGLAALMFYYVLDYVDRGEEVYNSKNYLRLFVVAMVINLIVFFSSLLNIF